MKFQWSTGKTSHPPNKGRGTSHSKRREKHIFFYAIISIIIIPLIIVFFLWYPKQFDPVKLGKQINQSAWEHSYIERSLPIPPNGPREGYWGARIGTRIAHPYLGWHEPSIFISGLLDIDKNGFQYYKSDAKHRYHILILGGSVAFGAYASSVSRTYFNIIGKELAHYSTPSDITIIASGAWKSIQEIRALELYGQTLKPDLVVFLNGLNDLTNGATSKSLYGQRIETIDGSEWTVLYHAHDYEQRVKDYLIGMKRADEIIHKLESKLVIVLQPSLVERSNRTQIEESILKLALKPHKSSAALRKSYNSMRQGLREIARSSRIHFIDYSQVLNGEKATIFADLWHFSDVGHGILGKALARKISIILKQQ